MRTWREKFEAMAVAVAFAEQGEWETAKSLAEENRRRSEDAKTDVKRRPERRLTRQPYRT